MNNRSPTLIAWATLALFAGVPALAGTPSDVGVQLAVYRVDHDKDGREQLTPIDRAKPGDALEYQALYKNAGKTKAKNVQATLPIPSEDAVFITESAKPASFFASIDGRNFEPAPLKRWVIK